MQMHLHAMCKLHQLSINPPPDDDAAADDDDDDDDDDYDDVIIIINVISVWCDQCANPSMLE